ncbi:hypothetical protein [Clostridium sp. Cult1]|uniref:hypothetical protein n=1 Tax=Clostridium sp. Cult1 TaxID=2079002 RepID=UPI001F42147F|nr:hypothetical protein [Clostridium sp. Cult1]MCF6462967.1 hypothetical protein [Clostridium sp. Cult1]
MLLMGILFLILGIFAILNQRYTIIKVGNERNIVEKAVNEKTGIYKYKIFLGLFSIAIGIFCILNYIIY